MKVEAFSALANVLQASRNVNRAMSGLTAKVGDYAEGYQDGFAVGSFAGAVVALAETGAISEEEYKQLSTDTIAIVHTYMKGAEDE